MTAGPLMPILCIVCRPIVLSLLLGMAFIPEGNVVHMTVSWEFNTGQLQTFSISLFPTNGHL